LLLNCNLNDEVKREIHNILLKNFFQADGITRAKKSDDEESWKTSEYPNPNPNEGLLA